MTRRTSSLARNVTLTSPVKAPFSSGWQCWAPSSRSTFFSDEMYVCTVRRSVKGGCTDTSTRA